jgi:transposase-like protein
MLSNKQESISLETLADILRNLSKEDYQRTIDLVEHSQEDPERDQGIPVDSPKCPHCSSHHVHRNGFANGGKQRYICNDCHCTFGETTGTVRYKSKHSQETWEAYLEAFALRLPLRDAACRCGISLSTAFFWRHKILDALSDGVQGRVLSGQVQEDETYIQDNYKGNCNADNNLKTIGESHPHKGLEQTEGLRPMCHRRAGKNAVKGFWQGDGATQPSFIRIILASG